MHLAEVSVLFVLLWVKPSPYVPVTFPPIMVFNLTDLEDLIKQLLPPFVIAGDFNSHNTLWGCNKLDRRGKLVEDILTKRNLCILNQKSSTYIHPATGSQSVIDLGICSPDIFWICSGALLAICVGVTTTLLQHTSVMEMHHMQTVAGNSVKQTGFPLLIGPANS